MDVGSQSELAAVLSSLEAHWNVLEAEIIEINKDIAHCEECLKKYGNYFLPPLEHLRELKASKKAIMKEIIRNMENFNENLQGGKKLVKLLNKQTFVMPSSNSGLFSSTNLSGLNHSTQNVVDGLQTQQQQYHQRQNISSSSSASLSSSSLLSSSSSLRKSTVIKPVEYIHH